MYLTLADMQTFLKFISGSGNEKVLSSAMLREWFLPRMLMPDGVSGFGMPWEMTQAGATWVSFRFPHGSNRLMFAWFRLHPY
jgi:hypothetical protein